MKLLKSTLLKLLLIFLLPIGGSVYAKDDKTESRLYLSLDEAITLALNNNPKLDVAESKFNAMLNIPDQVGALPEPRLMLNAVNLPLDSFSLNQTPMTQIQIGISQDLPYPGKLSLKMDVAEQEALAKKEEINSTSTRITYRVKYLWWRLFFLDRSLDTLASNVDLLREFIDVAETKYTVGQGLQQEVLLAHVELAKIEDNQLQVDAMRLKTQAMLNALLNRDSSTRISIDKDIPLELHNTKKLANLIELATSERPEVKQALLKISAAKKRVELAEKDYYPNFKLGAIYGWRQDETGLGSVQLSMNLPFNIEKRQDKKKDQRKQEWLEKKYVLEDIKNSVEEQIYKALTDYDQSRKQTSIYLERILPQANQTVESMLAGYQVNKVDFLSLLRSQVNLFNFQTQYWQSFSNANQALAAIEYAVGKGDIYEE